MQIQLAFRNRDLLREACRLRLEGNKDLLHHFVSNNAVSFDRTTGRDEVWEMMGEISLVPGSASYEAREHFSRALRHHKDPRVEAAVDYLSIGEFSKAVTTLYGMVTLDPRLSSMAGKLDSIALLHCVQRVADLLRRTTNWPTDRLFEQYVWAIENDPAAIERIKRAARFSPHCGAEITALVRKIAATAGFNYPRQSEMGFIIAEINGRILNRSTGILRRTTADELDELEVNSTTNEKEEIMNKTAAAFETKHYVFGQDVSEMSDEQLIAAIKDVEAEIAKLDTVKTKSKKIDAKKAELNDMLAKIVETLDGR